MIDPSFFPDRASLQYRMAGRKDRTGGPSPGYQPGPTDLPCSVQDGAAVDVPGLRAVGTKVMSAVWFPAEGPAGDAVAALRRGGILTLTCAGEPAPLVHDVVRVDRMGIGDFQLWQVYTTRRE